jgi:hypothetical protein
MQDRRPRTHHHQARRPRAIVAPLSATRYRVELTISAEVKAPLRELATAPPTAAARANRV